MSSALPDILWQITTTAHIHIAVHALSLPALIHTYNFIATSLFHKYNYCQSLKAKNNKTYQLNYTMNKMYQIGYKELISYFNIYTIAFLLKGGRVHPKKDAIFLILH